MNLVMYRMEDTERLRSKMRERRRREVFEKAEKEEEDEKALFERVERNKRWRAVREGGRREEDEKKDKGEREERKEKNREWRERRSSEGSQVSRLDISCFLSYLQAMAASVPRQELSSLLLTELLCPFCQVMYEGREVVAILLDS